MTLLSVPALIKFEDSELDPEIRFHSCLMKVITTRIWGYRRTQMDARARGGDK